MVTGNLTGSEERYCTATGRSNSCAFSLKASCKQKHDLNNFHGRISDWLWLALVAQSFCNGVLKHIAFVLSHPILTCLSFTQPCRTTRCCRRQGKALSVLLVPLPMPMHAAWGVAMHVTMLQAVLSPTPLHISLLQ